MLYNRLFRQVDRGWMQRLRLLLLLLLLWLLLLPLREPRRFGVAAGRLLPIPGNETPEEP
jgi:hypothetical protein